MKQILILMLVVIFALSCDVKDEELTMVRTDYAGNAFRLDGGYVGSMPNLSKYSSYTFFYLNGIVYDLVDVRDIEDINQFTGGLDYSRKACWGIFSVNNNTIMLQQWRLSGSEFYYQNIVSKKQYKIINDTTLLIEYDNGSTGYSYFKKFSPKPDSTNVFIK